MTTGRTQGGTGAAWRVARVAAQRADVEILPLHGELVSIAQEVIRQAWGPQQVPQDNLLRAMAHAGTSLLGALHSGRPVGACVGLLGWTGGVHLHSHMTAVVTDAQSGGVGYALKLWQRAECLDAGVREIRWTYDPLIARNAYFNLVKLGVRVIAFHPDFYGAMDDTVNAGDSSDRFEVSWLLDSQEVVDAIEGTRPPLAAPGETVRVPRDFDRLRRSDPESARLMRVRRREDFLRLLRPGTAVGWADGGYVLVPPAGSGVRSKATEERGA